MRQASGVAVTNFIRENIICQFDIPKHILSDNGTLVVIAHVIIRRIWCRSRELESIPSPREDQAEATNNTLPEILNKMVYEEPKLWADFLSLVLWSYRT